MDFFFFFTQIKIFVFAEQIQIARKNFFPETQLAIGKARDSSVIVI